MPSACTSPENSARRESKSTPPILAASKRTWMESLRTSTFARAERRVPGWQRSQAMDQPAVTFMRGAAPVTQGTRETGSGLDF
jgi:hypothetical protein